MPFRPSRLAADGSGHAPPRRRRRSVGRPRPSICRAEQCWSSAAGRAARKWRRSPLKCLDSRPEMVWPRRIMAIESKATHPGDRRAPSGFPDLRPAKPVETTEVFRHPFAARDEEAALSKGPPGLQSCVAPYHPHPEGGAAGDASRRMLQSTRTAPPSGSSFDARCGASRLRTRTEGGLGTAKLQFLAPKTLKSHARERIRLGGGQGHPAGWAFPQAPARAALRHASTVGSRISP